MDDPLSHGHAFEHGDLWRLSTFSKDLIDSAVFSPLDLSLPKLEEPSEQSEAVFDLHIPDLGTIHDVSESHDSFHDTLAPLSKSVEEDDVLLDVWDLDSALKSEKEAPKLRTWEAFGKKDVPDSDQTALLSEAGSAAFDAWITSLEPRDETGVLPQDYTLRALCNLALGRASSLFQWNLSKHIFEQTLPGVAISGLSKVCSESFTQELVQMGSTISKLRAFTTLPQSLRKRCTALIAMQNCVSEMLDAVDESMSAKIFSVRSLVQLRNLVRKPGRLVKVLGELATSVRGQDSDDTVISSLSDRVHLEIQIAPELQPALHALLARVSGPWLEQLASDLGFGTSASTMIGQPSAQKSDLTFIALEDKDLLHETMNAVSVLRDQAPAHPLLTQGLSAKNTLFSSFLPTDNDSQQMMEVSGSYQERMLSLIKGDTVPGMQTIVQDNPFTSDIVDQVWHDEDFRQNYFGRLQTTMSNDVRNELVPAISATKSHVLHLCSGSSNSEQDAHELTDNLVFNPLERIRPLIRTQNRLVNGVLMRQLFRDHKLREHLDVQRAFHLFGNGEFVSRLSTALFSEDVQSAERRRGKLPTSEAMGLRLGTTHEDRWPPASSELQLTLLGILVQTYKGQQVRQRSFVQSQDLPGSLSFSIRELPEEEIERVLDPNSIYALDFLRLQYIAKAPLNAILTPDALQKYDGIFKYLLRLLRIVHVTADLGRKAAARRNETANENAVCFTHAAHHLITILLSHVMDIGIAAPWRDLMQAIRKLEQTLADEDASDQMGMKVTFGIEGLRQLHDTCLERIRNRLFLKRKQEKLRTRFEDTLAALLKCAFTIHHDQSYKMPAFTSAYEEFQQKLKKLHTMLQEQANKPPKATAADDIEDAEMLRLLLARLNWNEFYS